MAGPYDPFTPGAPDPAVGGMIPNFGQLQQQIGTYLGDPNVRAALLSTGLAMMQPPHFGDTGGSQFARAISEGGGASAQLTSKAADDERKLQIAESEAASKQDLRGSQADLAGARADTAGAKSNAAADRLAFQREALHATNERNLLNNRVRASLGYQKYMKDTADQNTKASILGGKDFQPAPILPFSDWSVQNGYDLGGMGGGGGTSPETATTPIGGGGPAPAIPPISSRQNGMKVWSAKLGRDMIWNATTGKWD